MKYTNLHVHSEHSLLDGAAKITALAESAAKAGQTHLALTDHGSLCGSVAHKKACEKNGIAPLYGIELFMIEHFKDLEKTKQQNLHLTAIAKTQKGFELLLKSQGFANQYGSGKSGRFRRPFLPIRYPLENGWKDHVVILSGCSSSPFWNLKDSDGVDLFAEYCDYFRKDIYGEIMPLHDWDVQKDVNELVYEASKAKGIKLVTTNDIHYCRAEDSGLHEIVTCMAQPGMTWNSDRRWKFSTHQNYFRTGDSMVESIINMGLGSQIANQSVLNTEEVAEKCSFKLQKYGLDLPNPLPNHIDEEEYFFTLCHKGMKDRGVESCDVYWDRLEKEIGVLQSKGFIRYMLIVADLINWSKNNGIFIGPARGSSAGSLVAYVLKITEVDPIKHGLLFERFVAPDRCFTGETQVAAEFGNTPIENINKGDFVWTRGGLKRVNAVHKNWYSGNLKNISTKMSQLRCTPNHPLVQDINGEIKAVQAQSIKVGDSLACFRPFMPSMQSGVSPDVLESCLVYSQVPLRGLALDISQKMPCLPKELFGRIRPEILLPSMRETNAAKHRVAGVGRNSQGFRSIFQVKAGSGLCEDVQRIRSEMEVRARDIYSTGRENLQTGFPSERRVHRNEGLGWARRGKAESRQEIFRGEENKIQGSLSGGINGRIKISTKEESRVEVRDIRKAQVAALQNGNKEVRYMREGISISNMQTEENLRPELFESNEVAKIKIKSSSMFFDLRNLWERNLELYNAREKDVLFQGLWVEGDLVEKAFEEKFEGWVYNLTVEELPEYFANGFLVHNCDLPDVDIDVEDRKRQAVEQYLKEKYGSDNVGHLSTFSELLGRSALRDVARIFEVPPIEVDIASKCIIKRLDSDARAYDTIEDTINESQTFRDFNDKYPQIVGYAGQLEGQIKGTGVHAAGYVLSNNKLNESNRCYLVKGNSGISAVNWDKDDLEFFGLVKIDLLGLAMHSVISGCLELIEKRTGKKILMADVPLDDQKVIESIGRGETAAIFQLSTIGLTRYCKDLKPENFEDIAATTALWRPGPIQAGMATAYAEVRHGRLTPEYLCKEHKVIASPTRGQLIYQEQITELLIQLSGMTYSKADNIRKIMGKRLGELEWKKYEEEFVQGCKSKGTINEVQAIALWERLKGFATYAFNKSHAVAYGLISYWTAYLKLYYPTEYLCSYLNFGSTDKENKDGETNLDIALAEAQRVGISILNPSINESKEDWSVAGEKALRSGLKEIRNIGPAAKEELTRLRSSFQNGFVSIEQFVSMANKRKLNIRGVKSLVASGAFDDMPDVADYRKKLELTGTKEERDQYLNYSEAKLCSREEMLKQMSEVLGVPLEKDCLRIGNQLVNFEDAFAGRLPVLISGVINEKKIRGITELRQEVKDCNLCELYKGCKAPVPIEKGKFNLMIVGEAPGYNEDKRSRPLIGKPGAALFEVLEELGLPREFFYIDNVLHCKPSEGKPTPEMIDGCPHLDKSIAAVKPKLILSLGNSSLYYFKKRDRGILSFNGTTEWSQKHRCWVTYSVHPSYALQGTEDSWKTLRIGLNEYRRMIEILLGS